MLGVTALSRIAAPAAGRRQAGDLRGRPYRLWGVLIAAVAWIGLAVSHLVGVTQAEAVFSVIDVLTWGVAVAVLVPTDDGIEFSVVSVASSASLLVGIGVVLVKFQHTGWFVWALLAVGALSLFVQLVYLLAQIRWSRRAWAPPQPVPSIMPQPVPSIVPRPVPSISGGQLVKAER